MADLSTPEGKLVERLEVELVAVRELVKVWSNRAFAAERERDELKAEVERLREALKPFATFGEHNTDAEGWAGTECQRERIVDWFGPTDFRTARAALRTTEESP